MQPRTLPSLSLRTGDPRPVATHSPAHFARAGICTMRRKNYLASPQSCEAVQNFLDRVGGFLTPSWFSVRAASWRTVVGPSRSARSPSAPLWALGGAAGQSSEQGRFLAIVHPFWGRLGFCTTSGVVSTTEIVRRGGPLPVSARSVP